MDNRRSSLAIGRRTRTNILKGKYIRKDKFGGDVFEDYWTDSEDDQSSYNSHSSSAAISSKSVKDINQSEQNFSDSGSMDSGNKSPEAKSSPVKIRKSGRLSESKNYKSGSTINESPAEISIGNWRRLQTQESSDGDLSGSKPSPNKKYILSHDEFSKKKRARMHEETYLNDIKNQPNNASTEETAILDNHAVPKNSTMISKQSNVLNFNDASVIEFSDNAVPSTSRTVNRSKVILKSPQKIAKKHLIDLMGNKNLENTELGAIKTVSPLSKILSKTITLSDKDTLKSAFHNPSQDLDDLPRTPTKLNKGSKASAVSPNLTFTKSSNLRKSFRKQKGKTRSAVEMKKILSNYDEYDARILQIIRENSKNNEESSEKNAVAIRTQIVNESMNVTNSNDISVLNEPTIERNSSNEANQPKLSKKRMLSNLSDNVTRDKMSPSQGKNTRILSNQNKNISTSKSFVNTEEDKSSAEIVTEDSSRKLDQEQSILNTMNVSEKVLGHPVPVTAPKPQISHSKEKNTKDASPVKEMFDNELDTNNRSPGKKKLKSFDISKQTEESSSDDNTIENTSSKRNKKLKVSKNLPKNVLTVSRSRNNYAEQNNMKDKSPIAVAMDENYESDTNNRSPGGKKSFDISKQTEESSSDDSTIENTSSKRNKKLKVSKNLPKNVLIVSRSRNKYAEQNNMKDKSLIAIVMDENYESDTSDQSEKIARKKSESGVSHYEPVRHSSANKNKSFERTEQINKENRLEYSAIENTSVYRKKNVKRKVSKHIPKNVAVSRARNNNTEQNNRKDKSAVTVEMYENYDSDTHNQYEQIAQRNSESHVSRNKSVHLSYVNKNKSLKSSEESKQIEESKSDDIIKNARVTRGKKGRPKVSGSRNILKSVHETATVNKAKSTKNRNETINKTKRIHDRSRMIEERNENNDFETTVESDLGISFQKPLEKNKSLISLEKSKEIEESSGDSDIEATTMSSNASKLLEATLNRSSHGKLFGKTTNKIKICTDTNANEEVPEMDIDINHHSNICLDQAADELPSIRKRPASKKKHSLSKKAIRGSDQDKQIRKSTRQRYPPLAHWRNQRLLYGFEKGTVKVYGVEEGTRADNYATEQIIKRLEKKPKKKVRKIKKSTIYDSINKKTVTLTLGKTFQSVPWQVSVNADPNYSYCMKRLLDSTNCAFGYLEINIHSSKPAQYVPGEDLQLTVIKGQIEVVIQDNNFTAFECDMFVVPRNTAYTLKNIGHTKALLSYAVGKFRFLENSLSK